MAAELAAASGPTPKVDLAATQKEPFKLQPACNLGSALAVQDAATTTVAEPAGFPVLFNATLAAPQWPAAKAAAAVEHCASTRTLAAQASANPPTTPNTIAGSTAVKVLAKGP